MTDSPFDSWRDRVRDPILTALLAVQCVTVFLAAPFVAAGYYGSRLLMEVLGITFAVLVVLASRSHVATIIAILASLFTIIGSALDHVSPTPVTVLLTHVGSVGSFILVGYIVVGAVFAPGAVNAHRVRGAIVLYLNFGMLLATGYRLLWDFIPSCLTGIPEGTPPWQASGTMLYFSFITLTTIGYGDVVPVHPLARGLANLEGIIGQLYPATILARLVTLQIEEGRRR